MADRRYDEQQIGAILQRAGEIQAGLTPETDSQGVTLHDLQKVASEVGIEPHIVERAARELDTKPATARLLDSKTSRMLDQTIEGSISEDQWDDVVMSLRQLASHTGTSSVHGTTREWTSGGDVSSITFTAQSRNDRTRFRLLADTSAASFLFTFLGSVLGFLLTIGTFAVMKKGGQEASVIAITVAAMMATIFLLTSTWIRFWQRKTHKKIAAVFESIVSTMSHGASLTPQLTESKSDEERQSQQILAE
jgi:hypothetical protein